MTINPHPSSRVASLNVSNSKLFISPISKPVDHDPILKCAPFSFHNRCRICLCDFFKPRSAITREGIEPRHVKYLRSWSWISSRISSLISAGHFSKGNDLFCLVEIKIMSVDSVSMGTFVGEAGLELGCNDLEGDGFSEAPRG